MLRKIFFICISVLSIGVLEARRRLSSHMPGPVCDEQGCLDENNNCLCYCAQKGDYRQKEASDNPVWVAEGVGARGVHCFCKQWDLDAYKAGKNGNGSRARIAR